MSPKTLKNLHTIELCTKAISILMWILAIVGLAGVLLTDVDNVLQLFAIKVFSAVAFVLCAVLGYLFSNLSKRYARKFRKVLRRRDLRAVFNERMANL